MVVRDLSVVHEAADMDGFFVGDCDGQSASNLHTGAIALNCTAESLSSPSPSSSDAQAGGDSGDLQADAACADGQCCGVTVENVEVAHTGGFGVITQSPVSGLSLRRLHVHDIGAGGVNIGSAHNVTEVIDHPDSVLDVSLEDSEIHDGGHVYRMGPGVMLQSCHGCAVVHNHIHNFFCEHSLRLCLLLELEASYRRWVFAQTRASRRAWASATR